MDAGERRELYSGFGDSLVRAFEFAATPALFGLIGHFLDRRLGTGPWLTMVLVVFALIGLTVRVYYGYVADMEALEATAPWARVSPSEEGVPLPELGSGAKPDDASAGRPSVDLASRTRSGAQGHPLAGA
ncbi:MAG: AtpZ/AtpI family protein [Actinomycetota bacterium]|nr:AtpZ/AtpI family protein [Actinomycetota bacterium]